MPLDSRKVAHIAANRRRIRAGRDETVTLVAASGGIVSYLPVAGVVWHDAGVVAAGVAPLPSRVTGHSWDALAEFPGETAFPDDLRLIARTGDATPTGVAGAERYEVLDRVRAGLGTSGSGGGASAGNRWVVKLRRMR